MYQAGGKGGDCVHTYLLVSARRLKLRPKSAMNLLWLTSSSALTPRTTQSNESYSLFKSRNLSRESFVSHSNVDSRQIHEYGLRRGLSRIVEEKLRTARLHNVTISRFVVLAADNLLHKGDTV